MAKRKRSQSDDGKDLLRRMSAKSEQVIEKVVRFTNNDAPEYLRNLKKFEQESRNTRIVIR